MGRHRPSGATQQFTRLGDSSYPECGGATARQEMARHHDRVARAYQTAIMLGPSCVSLICLIRV